MAILQNVETVFASVQHGIVNNLSDAFITTSVNSLMTCIKTDKNTHVLRLNNKNTHVLRLTKTLMY